MTKNEFINRIKRRIDRNKSLPITLGNDEIEDIIYDAKNWFYDNYGEATYEFITLIPLSIFKTEHFKKNRYIQFEDCVYSIYEFIENKHNAFHIPFEGIKYTQNTVINSINYVGSYDITTYVANKGYESVLQNLSDHYISFDWNMNSKTAYIIGHDPQYDVIIRGFKKIEDQYLFNDDLFRQYVEGQSRIAIGEILGMYEFNYPGGISLSADSYITRGESMVEEIKEEMKELNKPLYFMTF